MELHGFLPIDKPLGWTSHDVVAKTRRVLGTRRVGHAGTLDPAATGVLVLGVGKATRFMESVQNSSKGYVAHVVLGINSETADIDGRVEPVQRTIKHVDRDDLDWAVSRFIGQIDQVPPKYSAIKQGGVPIYRKVRRGEPVEVPVRSVIIHDLRVISYRFPDLILAVECGSGVYIRSLAQDLGDVLGCGAYLHHLLRTRVGRFGLSQCWTMKELMQTSQPRDWHLVSSAIDIGAAIPFAVPLDRDDTTAWYHGRSVRTDSHDAEQNGAVRAYTIGGEFAGLGELAQMGDTHPWVRPRIVLAGD